jgi:hypothetical protein
MFIKEGKNGQRRKPLQYNWYEDSAWALIREDRQEDQLNTGQIRTMKIIKEKNVPYLSMLSS